MFSAVLLCFCIDIWVLLYHNLSVAIQRSTVLNVTHLRLYLHHSSSLEAIAVRECDATLINLWRDCVWVSLWRVSVALPGSAHDTNTHERSWDTRVQHAAHARIQSEETQHEAISSVPCLAESFTVFHLVPFHLLPLSFRFCLFFTFPFWLTERYWYKCLVSCLCLESADVDLLTVFLHRLTKHSLLADI